MRPPCRAAPGANSWAAAHEAQAPDGGTDLGHPVGAAFRAIHLDHRVAYSQLLRGVFLVPPRHHTGGVDPVDDHPLAVADVDVHAQRSLYAGLADDDDKLQRRKGEPALSLNKVLE
eukprot:CAMPEP_0204076100 /NCGR_PEP_ID=MMETSP0360-20130528/167349_1 /ASSEMBLY_ACC=CAM_ASM_000342 /TAXON_ID=268821 /ORGANISM="Scrippsiella Hangoei, Strain SHTV-5" /LENGTH=115 /DNA_ID=CAMNT_0051024629 /DNA_START=99 /DNA_END=444 /DNA_ORIENTATION=-